MRRILRIIPVFLLFAALLCPSLVATLAPRLTVDTRLSNVYISDHMTVAGWALNSSSVREIDFNLDGRLIGRTGCGGSRPDVRRIYPSYPNAGKSGFVTTLNINTATLAEGRHTMKITAVGYNKTTVSRSFSVNYRRAVVCIDQPRNGSTFYDSVVISGWALNASGTSQVNVLVDGNPAGTAAYGGYRPDVNNIYPGFPSGNYSGYSLTVSLGAAVPGTHRITVQTVDGNGRTATNSVQVKKAPTLLCVDTQFGLINKTLSVGGWALGVGGIREVDFYIDGAYLGNTQTNFARPDVKNIFPGYAMENGGYNFTVDDPSKIPSGKHTLTVKAVGVDGGTATQSFTIQKLAPMGYIDSPKQNTNMVGLIDVSGWALNASGIKQIDVYLDNKTQPEGNATLGISRPDVQRIMNASGGYLSADTSGYDCKIDISAAAVGKHTIRVAATGNDGETATMQVSILIGNVSVSTKSYSISLSDFINQEMGDIPALAVSGHWRYAYIQNGQKGYYIDGDKATFRADANAYQQIYQKVAYYADPSQLEFDPVGVYEFLKLSWVDGITADQLNKNLGGVLAGKGQVFLDAAKTYNLNPVYLAGQSILETGNGTSTLAKGVVVNGKTCYNLFGINAFDSSPIASASQKAYASGWYDTGDGQGSNSGIYKAIFGGAQWIANNYINRQPTPQDTLYLIRWNPTNIYHQYATDVSYAASQTAKIKSYFDQYPGIKLYFEIPVFTK